MFMESLVAVIVRRKAVPAQLFVQIRVGMVVIVGLQAACRWRFLQGTVVKLINPRRWPLREKGAIVRTRMSMVM